MSQKRRSTAVVHQTRTTVTALRTPQVQTSGLFRLPAELLFEIFSYFNDHLDYIRDFCGDGGRHGTTMWKEHVERLTVIRKLTMTCRALRDALLPVLWKNTEGCVVRPSPPGNYTGVTYGLYAQCIYLASNPTVAAYVRVLSVDLNFRNAPKDLMKKFVDALVRLPNLWTLDLLDITHKGPITRGLKRKCATFPSIREMTVSYMYPDFIRSCPNLECLTLGPGFMDYSPKTLSPYGAGLKRVRGVSLLFGPDMEVVVDCCPNLQEIALHGIIYSGDCEILKCLRKLKHLSVVEVHISECKIIRGNPSDCARNRKIWKMYLIDVLKNSPSGDRKFLRWEASRRWPGARPSARELVEAEELEVLPELAL